MSWRNAMASLFLLQELNDRWPARDTLSDGTIGDAAHASRDSDHNPWIKDSLGIGVVRARDIDEDGIDGPWLAEHLRQLGAAGDERLANFGYVIYEGRIAGGNPARGPGRWAWRPYTGANAHRLHLHVSFTRTPGPNGFDSTAPWGITTTDTEDDDMFTDDDRRKLDELHRDYCTKGKGMRQVILETAQRVGDLVTGKRPGRR